MSELVTELPREDYYWRPNLGLFCQEKEYTMVRILDDNSEHVSHALRKIDLFGEKYPICDCSRSNDVPQRDPYVRTYF